MGRTLNPKPYIVVSIHPLSLYNPIFYPFINHVNHGSTLFKVRPCEVDTAGPGWALLGGSVCFFCSSFSVLQNNPECAVEG